MLNGKEGRLLRRNNDKDTNMKINILLCDDDKDFLQRISDAVAGQPVPPGASICITKSSNPAKITDRQLNIIGKTDILTFLRFMVASRY